MLKYLSDELREQRARLLARAAPLEADVGALLSATVDAVAPAAARPRPARRVRTDHECPASGQGRESRFGDEVGDHARAGRDGRGGGADHGGAARRGRAGVRRQRLPLRQRAGSPQSSTKLVHKFNRLILSKMVLLYRNLIS